MAYQWCHGPKCHTNRTQDRIRGNKGNKVLRTRKITTTRWNENNVWSVFCSQSCYGDFFYKYWQQVIAIAPRNEPLETPIEVEVVHHPQEITEYGWTRKAWTEKRIVDSPTEN